GLPRRRLGGAPGGAPAAAPTAPATRLALRHPLLRRGPGRFAVFGGVEVRRPLAPELLRVVEGAVGAAAPRCLGLVGPEDAHTLAGAGRRLRGVLVVACEMIAL